MGRVAKTAVRVKGWKGDGVAALSRAAMMLAGGAYEGADTQGQDLGLWNAPRTSGEIGPTERDIIRDRARDMVRNSGYAAGAVRSYVDNVIGWNLRPLASPDAARLGLTSQEARDVATQMEQAWDDWANHPGATADVTRQATGGALLAQAFRDYLVDGECLALLLARRTESPYRTALQLVDTDRLSQPVNASQSPEFRDGIAFNQDGAPLTYFIRRGHPADRMINSGADRFEWDPRPRSVMGMPLVLHVFERLRPGQIRGVSRFAPVLRNIRMLKSYSDAERQAAVLSAILAMTITSPFDHDLLASMMGGGPAAEGAKDLKALQDARGKYDPVALAGVDIKTLYPGEELQVHAPNRPNTAFGDFMAAGLAEVSSGFGGRSYEQFTGDWSRSNYSSARGGMVEAWKTVLADRARFAAGFVRPLYFAVIQEAIDLGRVQFPRHAAPFEGHAAAWCRAQWIGPARGWVDPVKEAQAAVLRMTSGLSTLQAEAAEQGQDFETTATQIAREQEFLSRLGQAHPAGATLPEPVGGSAPDREEEEEGPAPGRKAR